MEMTERVQPASFRKPSPLEALFNRAMGALVGLGIGPGYMQLLLVRGRKTGRLYSTPVNLLQVGGKSYLVAPRGTTQWVRNAEATREILLKRGRQERKYRLRPVPDPEKPTLLKFVPRQLQVPGATVFFRACRFQTPHFVKSQGTIPCSSCSPREI